MAVVGTPRVFHKKFAFVVEIEGDIIAAFNKCSTLEAEVAKVEYFEGGALTPDKSPGRITVSDITLERGTAKGDSDLYNWFLDVLNMSANAGLIDAFYKREVEILQLDRDGNTLHRWLLHNCWPTKFVGGEWDNDADENVVESLTLTLDTFDKVDA